MTTKLIINSDPAIEVVSPVGAGVEGSFFGNQLFDYTDLDFSIHSTNSFCSVGDCVTHGPIAVRLEGLNFGAPLAGVSFTSLLQGVSVSRGSDFVQCSWVDQSIPGQTYLSARFITGVPDPEIHALMLAVWASRAWQPDVAAERDVPMNERRRSGAFFRAFVMQKKCGPQAAPKDNFGQ